MALVVTLDIFSGRPNPSWKLPDRKAAEVTERLTDERKSLLLTEAQTPGLGYRGFRIVETTSDRSVFGKRSSRSEPREVTITAMPELERLLMETGGDAINRELRPIIDEGIERMPPRFLLPQNKIPKGLRGLELARPTVPKLPPGRPQVGACPNCVAADAPIYNPDRWNIPTVQPFNNCYNYANNQITNTFAQPGRASGVPMTGMSCAGVQPSAVADGLAAAANFTTPLRKGQGWYVALVIWPGQDYHWYRQDRVGCWSHKAGTTPATDTDNSNVRISDPRRCDRGPYTVFCTYMVTNAGVHIN